jgi:hypothetical protein
MPGNGAASKWKERSAMNALTARSQAEPGSVAAVRAVSVISTGTVRIRPEHPYGTRKPLYWWLLTSREWTPPRPVNVYVIEHAKGLILFDTGQDRASVTDETYFPGGLTGHLYHRLARFDIASRTPSPPSWQRSGTPRPMSTPLSCRTCTRTTSAGWPS